MPEPDREHQTRACKGQVSCRPASCDRLALFRLLGVASGSGRVHRPDHPNEGKLRDDPLASRLAAGFPPCREDIAQGRPYAVGLPADFPQSHCPSRTCLQPPPGERLPKHPRNRRLDRTAHVPLDRGPQPGAGHAGGAARFGRNQVLNIGRDVPPLLGRRVCRTSPVRPARSRKYKFTGIAPNGRLPQVKSKKSAYIIPRSRRTSYH